MLAIGAFLLAFVAVQIWADRSGQQYWAGILGLALALGAFAAIGTAAFVAG